MTLVNMITAAILATTTFICISPQAIPQFHFLYCECYGLTEPLPRPHTVISSRWCLTLDMFAGRSSLSKWKDSLQRLHPHILCCRQANSLIFSTSGTSRITRTSFSAVTVMILWPFSSTRSFRDMEPQGFPENASGQTLGVLICIL